MSLSGREKYHMLQNFYAISDGLKLRLQQSIDAVEQELVYNECTHDHYGGNEFVFALSGNAIACAVNAPSSMLDSCIAEYGSVYDILETMYERTDSRVVVDSAFARERDVFLINSSHNEQGAEKACDTMQTLQATSVWQASE